MPLNEEIPDTKILLRFRTVYNMSLGASWHNA